VRVVIAEDSVLLRAGLERLLVDEGIDVVATAGDGVKLLAAVEELQPGLAVLVLSQCMEDEYARELFAGDATGLGYLLKDRVADVREFVEAVRRVGAGGTALDPDVVAQLLGRHSRDTGLDALTPREREVLSLMAEGRSNRAIAEKLVISAGAVEEHIGNAFAKLGLEPDQGNHRRVLAVLQYWG